MRRIRIALLLFVLAMAFAGPAVVLAQGFSADVKFVSSGQETTARIQVSGKWYRIEIMSEGGASVQLVDLEAGIVNVLFPSNFTLITTELNDPQVLQVNPLAAVQWAFSSGEVRPDGRETVLGHDCEKFIVSQNGTDRLVKWESLSFGFPIKAVNLAMENSYLELSNIKAESFDPDFFSVPSRYKRMTLPQQTGNVASKPPWSDLVGDAPLLAPPFERSIDSGGIIRVKIEPGKSIWFVAKKVVGSDAEVRAVPFRDLRPLRDVTQFINFAYPGVAGDVSHATAIEADYIVVRVFSGSATVTARYGDVTERKINTGEEVRLPLVAGQNIEDFRIVNLSDNASLLTWQFYQNGEPVKNGAGVVRKAETVTLRWRGDAQKSGRVAAGDEMVIRVKRGEVVVKLAQYDPYGR